jgi:ABC-type methionine transport system ATPase subunit
VSDIKQIRVQLDYPLEHVKEPVIYHLVTDYRLIPNIRRANIDAHTGGMLVLEIDGDEQDLADGLQFLRSLGITVTEIGTEQPWTV